uniref:Uncharacterized protein n=1 Tax=Arundo donax TaxID=35708 RepID=A0A0A9ANW4_ARUDO
MHDLFLHEFRKLLYIDNLIRKTDTHEQPQTWTYH